MPVWFIAGNATLLTATDVASAVMVTSADLHSLREGAAEVVAIGRSNPNDAVPSCPDWRAIDLTGHLGGLYHWVTEIIATPVPLDAERPYRASPPDSSPDSVAEWSASGEAELVDALMTVDLDRPCWSFGTQKDGHFWLRRMTNETAIHAWDARSVLGNGVDINKEVAVDGIDEFLDLMLRPRLSRAPDAWHGETLHLHQSDGESEWLVRLGPGTSLEVQHAHAKGDVAVRASASDLFLWCTNRKESSALECFGDLSVLDRWTANVHF